MDPSPNYFIALSALGFGLLWGFMYSNGTLDALTAVKETGMFPDGRPIRLRYTGQPLIDDGLTTLTSFFDVVTNGLAPGPRLLFFNLAIAVQCTSIWVFIESRRRGVRSMGLRHPVATIFLWNSFGAAFIQPIFFYFSSQSAAVKRNHTIPMHEARAFPLTTLVSLLFPLMLFVPAMLNYPIEAQHGYIALFSATPLFMVAVLFVASRPGAGSEKNVQDPDIYKPYIVTSFYTAGAISAAVHLYTLTISLTSKDPDTTFTRLFIPSPGRVSSVSSNRLVEGAHLFTQFDWIIASVACLLYVRLLLRSSPRNSAESGMPRELDNTRDFGLLALATVICGPSAVGSFMLAIREPSLGPAQEDMKRE